MAGEPWRFSEGESLEDDVRTIWSNMQRKEKEIWQKRLFLMGLSDTDTLEEKGKSPAGKREFLLESFMRKDDVFYEELKQIVEKRFGIHNDDAEQHPSHGFVAFRNIRHMSRVILGLLDDFTNRGLYRIAKVLTEDSVDFEKTRPQMKRVIMKSLGVLQGQGYPSNQDKIQSQVSDLLGNQKNFRHNHIKHLNVTLKSHGAAVIKVLDGLGDIPTQALSAMYRKLKGVQGYVPQLQPPKSGWNRSRLIDRVRSMSLEMIGQLSDFEVLPEPLTKAMAVAGLNSKLVSGCDDISLTRFVHATPEVEALQKDIFQAVHILSHRTKKKVIGKLQQLLAPKSEMGTVGAKAIKNMLIEFLYECIDMETFPDSLLDALSIVNQKPSRRLLSKDLIEEQVEEVLNLSASIKQMLLDNIAVDKLDEDFADAYMEELVESDDGDLFDEDEEEEEEEEEEEMLTDGMHGVQIRLNDVNEDVQSTGDPHDANTSSSEVDSSSSSSGVARCFGDDECMHTAISGIKTSSRKGSSHFDIPMLDCDNVAGQDVEKYKLPDLGNCAAGAHSGSLCLEGNQISESDKKIRNRYVAIQEVSDQASLTLYRLVGHMTEELAKAEGLELTRDDVSYLRGDSSRREHPKDAAADPKGQGVSGAEEGVSGAVVRAVLNVMPSFPTSELEKIEKFLNSLANCLE